MIEDFIVVGVGEREKIKGESWSLRTEDEEEKTKGSDGRRGRLLIYGE